MNLKSPWVIAGCAASLLSVGIWARMPGSSTKSCDFESRILPQPVAAQVGSMATPVYDPSTNSTVSVGANQPLLILGEQINADCTRLLLVSLPDGAQGFAFASTIDY